MKKRTFLHGAGMFALAGSLAVTPAYASDGNTDGSTHEAEDASESAEVDDYRLPVETTRPLSDFVTPASLGTLNNFAGLRLEARSSFDTTIDLSAISPGVVRSDAVSAIDPRIYVRDDVGLDASFDAEDTQPSVVQIFSQNNASGGVFLNCTGTVINPRTILTAAHCLNFQGSESYGLPETGAQTTMLIGTGPNTASRLFTTLGTGVGYDEGGVASSTDVVIHPSANLENGGLPFPFADIALIAVDSPITDVPAMPILLSPLTELTHVVQAGYGSFGTGLGGPGAGSNLLRRVGENMLGAVASFADFDDAVFANFAPTANLGSITQTYYWTDFDWPDRDAFGFEGCTITPNGIQPCSLGNILATDWFEGDALPREVATAPGDSGSPLIVDELYEFPVATAVLSGGRNFFRNFLLQQLGFDNTYGDISFYNPIYPFFQFITENTSYKYVSALEGDGNWSDPTHWTQDLDPGFFIDDGTGTLVNGIPEGEEDGIFDTGPNVGIIAGTDISDFPEIVSPFGPQPGDPNFGGNLPASSALLGPGSTGFVPNNTDGTPGIAFANPAQYFEVHLNRAGTTTVDLDVEIDKLVIDNGAAAFVLPDQQTFSSLIGVEHLAGTARIHGTLSTPIYTLASGILDGDGGVIDTNALFNVSGIVSAGGIGGFGSLTIDGDYVQTSGGALWVDYEFGQRSSVTSDTFEITGLAVLDGDLIVATESPRVKFGAQFTVLTADTIDGTFANTTLLTRSPILIAESRVEGDAVIVELGARSIRGLVGRQSGLESLGATLDNIRATRFDEYSSLFDVVDNATFATLGSTLTSLTPVSAFSQTFTANGFSQRFTGQIAQRTLALRGGSRGAGAFSAAGNASFAIAGDAPAKAGQFAVFGSASGVYLNGGQSSGLLGNGLLDSTGYLQSGSRSLQASANAIEQATLSQAGELLVGADVQLIDGFSFGVAVSNIQNSRTGIGVLQPQRDASRSVAIYVTYADEGLFADGYAGTSDQQFGVSRASLGDFRDSYSNAVGHNDGEQVFGGVRLGYAFDLTRGLEVGPVVSLDYVRNFIGGYDEIGAGSLGLSIADRTFTSLGAKAGAMASLDLHTGESGSISAFGSVAYAREMADTSDVVTASFFGAEDLPFTVANQLNPDWVSVNAGAEIDFGANMRASLSVTSDMGRGPLSNEQAQASMSWRF